VAKVILKLYTFIGLKAKLCIKSEVSVAVLFAVMKSNNKLNSCMNGLIQGLSKTVINMKLSDVK
jgi:hypothetical protein